VDTRPPPPENSLAGLVKSQIRRPFRHGRIDEAAELGLRHIEAGVDHMQRRKDAALQELVERLAGGHLDDPAEDVGAQAVFVNLAGLMGERHARQSGNEIRQRRVASVCGRVDPAVKQMDHSNTEIGGCVRRAPFRIRKIHFRIDQARRMAQQISNRHRAFWAFW
jgi:hypothetical protein